jgi:hypothetical protein
MGWSLALGVINGTTVRVHITFLLLLAWIGFAAYARGGQAAAVQNVVYIVLLFACVVLLVGAPGIKAAVATYHAVPCFKQHWSENSTDIA